MTTLKNLRLEAGFGRIADQPSFVVAVNKEGNVINPDKGFEKLAMLIVDRLSDVNDRVLGETSVDLRAAYIAELGLNREAV